MAKNVSITEDGNSKTIENAAKIRTSLIGGGTCDWIPKDDVPLQTLTVTEDGTYRPEQNYYGFSQVTASGIGNVIEGALIEKTITKNGTYNIKDESGSPYGYSKIIVNIDTSGDDSGGDSGGGNTPVVGKDEDGNDTMAEADDEGNIVMTALPTDIKVIIPPTKLEYNRYEEIDYSGISVYAYISKEIHWLGTTTTAVTEGSSDNTVSIDDSNVTVSVGDGILYAPDQTGQNDVQLVWDGTKWIKPSNYSAEKAIWKSDKYPTGKIPFDELLFKFKRAQNNFATYDDSLSYEKAFIGKDLGEITTASYLNFSILGTHEKKKDDVIKLFIISSSSGLTFRDNIGEETYSVNLYLRNGKLAVFNRFCASPNGYYYVNNGSVWGFIAEYPIILAYNSVYDTFTLQYTHEYTKAYKMQYEYRFSEGGLREAYTYINGEYKKGIFIRIENTKVEYIYDGYYLSLIRISSFDKVATKKVTTESEYINCLEGDAVPSTKNVSSSLTTLEDGTNPLEFYIDGWGRNYSGLTSDGRGVMASTPVILFSDTLVHECNYQVNCPIINNNNGDALYDSTGYPLYIAEHMLYDDIQNQNQTRVYSLSLPVQWKRPGDGKILETTFTAWMKDDGGRAPGPQGGSGNYDVLQ